MIEFRLQEVWNGWEEAFTPDNLEIILKADHTEHMMVSSVKEIFELYGFLVNESTGEMFIGTGQKISVEKAEEAIIFEKPPIRQKTTYVEMKKELENLLRDLFKILDNREANEERAEQLDRIQMKLNDEIEYDVEEKYYELRE